MLNAQSVNTKLKMISLSQAIEQLNIGKIIIYPTDTVYGIGCLPSKTQALNQLLEFKKRKRQFILLIDNWDRYQDWLNIQVDQKKLKEARPTTWVLPASPKCPDLLKNPSGEIAIRQISHPITLALLQAINEPLISTSANFPGESTITSSDEADSLPFEIMEGQCGNQPPSQIIHYQSGTIIRP